MDRYRVMESFSDNEDNVARYFIRSPYHKSLIRLNDIYTRDRDFALMEKEMDNILISILRESRYSTLSVEPVIAFTLAMEFELRNIKLIIESRNSNVPETVIKERLRSTYV